MRPKTLFLFIVAIGCGLVASIGVSQYMEKAKTTATPGVVTQKIYVATTEISPGEQLDAKNVRLEEWPRDRIPEGATSDLKEVEEKYSRTRMYKGEPILLAKLSTSKDGNPDVTIPPGYRVIAVKVDEHTSAGGLIRPGNRVDLVVFLRKSSEVPETRTQTILRDVNVFAVEGRTERQEDTQGSSREMRTVSLLVTPKQVESVTLAKELGILSLTLRRPGDTIEQIGDGETIGTLLGMEGESANEKKKKMSEDSDEGLAKWLSNQTPAAVVAAAPQPPAPVVEPKQPPKFKMKIRTPNGDRVFHFQEFDSEPEEITQETADNRNFVTPAPAFNRGNGSSVEWRIEDKSPLDTNNNEDPAPNINDLNWEEDATPDTDSSSALEIDPADEAGR